MDKSLEKLDEKLSKISDEITEIKISQARTEVIMDTHIKRTALAEENIELLRKELQPIKKHVEIIDHILKSIGAIAAGLLFLNELDLLDNLLRFLF